MTEAVVLLEWAGCATGVLGALLLALHNAYSGWGFVSFLTSNMCWIAFGIITGAEGLVVMQIAFTATSLLGLYKWFWVPMKNKEVSCGVQ